MIGDQALLCLAYGRRDGCRSITLHLLMALPSFWDWSIVSYSPFLRDSDLGPRFVRDSRQQGDGDRIQMAQEPGWNLPRRAALVGLILRKAALTSFVVKP